MSLKSGLSPANKKESTLKTKYAAGGDQQLFLAMSDMGQSYNSSK